MFFQITHHRTIRQLKTDYHIPASAWNEELSSIDLAKTDAASRQELQIIKGKVEWEEKRMKRFIWQKEQIGEDYSPDELLEEFKRFHPCQSVFELMQSVIDEKFSKNQICSARNFVTALRHLKEFRADADLTFAMLSQDMMERLEIWLQQELGLRRNTTSCYFRAIRTVWMKAVNEGLCSYGPVFARVYTGIDETAKRALTKADLCAIKELDLTKRNLAIARDMFLLSFYLRGMPFVDMAFLRKTDLKDGYVRYRRRKTRKMLEVRWEREMQEIADRYASLMEGSPYLLPIILRTDGAERKQYERAMCRQNRNLKTIGKMANLTVPLTQYAARHSWASIAYSSAVPISVISLGMGHSSERVTQTYIKSLEMSAVDRANRRIIKL